MVVLFKDSTDNSMGLIQMGRAAWDEDLYAVEGKEKVAGVIIWGVAGEGKENFADVLYFPNIPRFTWEKMARDAFISGKLDMSERMCEVNPDEAFMSDEDVSADGTDNT